MLTQAEIERRKPLWLAISDLWLDTEPTEMTYRSIAREMLQSGYPLVEIEKIYSEEVAPVAYSNLYNVFPGGVWDGFDTEWLNEKIIENTQKQERSSIYRMWIRSSAGKFVMTRMVQDDWGKTVEIYKSLKIS